MERSSAILGWLAVLAAPAAAADTGSDTPRAVYERNVACAGLAAAAVARESAQPALSDKDRSDAQALLTATREQADLSGGAIGAPPAEIAAAIERRKAGTLKRIEAAASDAARMKEDADLGRVVVECALVQTIEKDRK